MESSSEPRDPSEGAPPRDSFSQILHLVEKKAYVLLKDHRKRKWIWVILVGLASVESYFVRELLAALLLFTIVYIILAAAVVLYILFVDVLDLGTLQLESLGRSFLALVHHHFASPAALPSPAKDRTHRGIQKLVRR